MVRKFAKRALLAVLLAASTIQGNLYGQILNGNIIGSVTDAGGAVVPGVRVTIRSELTRVERSLLTESDGTYLFSSVPPSTYTVEAEHPGFRRYVNSGVAITSGRIRSKLATIGYAGGQFTQNLWIRS